MGSVEPQVAGFYVSIQGTELFRSSVPNNFCISVVHIFRIYEWQEDYDGNSTFPEKVLSVEELVLFEAPQRA